MKRINMDSFPHSNHLQSESPCVFIPIASPGTTSNQEEQPEALVTPDREKRQRTTTTTNDNRAVPFLQWSQIFRPKIVPRNLMTLGAEVMVTRTCSDLLALFEINQGNEESFIHPMIKFITTDNNTNEARDSFLKEVPVVAVVPRRTSKGDNTPIFKTGQGKNQYKKCYIVCFRPMGFTTANCRQIADRISSFLNTWRQANPYQGSNRESTLNGGSDPFTTVPDDFDQTPPLVKTALDWFVLDEDVMKIMKLFIQKRHLHPGFYQANKKLAKGLFSPPYPFIATKELGYDSFSADVV